MLSIEAIDFVIEQKIERTLCLICLEQLIEPCEPSCINCINVIGLCGHPYHRCCIKKVIENQYMPLCPACRAPWYVKTKDSTQHCITNVTDPPNIVSFTDCFNVKKSVDQFKNKKTVIKQASKSQVIKDTILKRSLEKVLSKKNSLNCLEKIIKDDKTVESIDTLPIQKKTLKKIPVKQPADDESSISSVSSISHKSVNNATENIDLNKIIKEEMEEELKELASLNNLHSTFLEEKQQSDTESEVSKLTYTSNPMIKKLSKKRG